MLETLRVGVIGCGAIAQIMHIPYLIEHERFELVSICDAYQPVLDAVSERYHIHKRYTDWNELLTNDDLDAVIICHAGSHRDSVIAALNANKHILVEKPLAWNLREVEEVAEHAKKSNRIVQMAYHKLSDPAFAYAKEQIDKMQDIGLIRISVLHPANELGFSPYRLRRGNGIIEEGHADIGTWQSQREGQLKAFASGALSPLVDEALGEHKDNDDLRLAYGIITISLIHQIYTMFGLFGEPKRVISTDIWRDGFSIHSDIEFENDIRCTLDWHFLMNLKDYREEYEVFGNHERVTFQLPAPYFKNFPSPVIIQGGNAELSWEKKVTVSHGEAFENELLTFYENIVNNKKPFSSIDDALKHTRFQKQLLDAIRL